MPKKKPDDFVPVKDFPKDHKHYPKPRCQKWSYTKGRQCLGFAKKGMDCCIAHGGKSLKGIAHPNYRHGKYVATLPKRLIENYDQVKDNPDYLKLQDEITLVDTRLLELTGKLNGSDSSQIFSNMRATVKAIETAQSDMLRSQNIADSKAREIARVEANTRFLSAVSDLTGQVKDGSREWYIWNDITDLIEKRRRLVDTERKLLVDMQMLVNTQDVMALLDAVMESVRRNVTDRNTRQQIQTDYNRLTQR